MKIILLNDIKNLGKKNDIIEVNDGYARNVLIKKKDAIEATSKNLNDLKLKLVNNDKLEKEKYEKALQLKNEIESKELKIKIKVGEGDRAFGSVSSKELSDEIEKQMNYKIDKKKISLSIPIKSIGNFESDIKLHPSVVAKLKIIVEKE